MLTLIVRAILVYLLVLLVFRLMGKRQIGQMQPFELVLTLVIADLATIPMAEAAIPTLNGVVPLITLVVVHFFLTFFSKKSPKVAKFISGQPVVIINPNGINFEAIEKLDISVQDVLEAIRGQGYFSLNEVQYAIMETNGVVNVLPKSLFSPVTPDVLNIKPKENGFPHTIIAEGNFFKSNLEKIKLQEDKLAKILEEKNVKNIKNVVVLTIDAEGECFLQEKFKPAVTFNIQFGGSENE